MILQAIKKGKIILLASIPVIAVLFWINVINNPQPVTTHFVYMPFYEILVNICRNNLLILNILACLFLIISAYSLIQINNKYVFIKQRVELPALIYILITNGIVELQGMQPIIPAVILLILAMDNVFSIYHEKFTISYAFNAGLYIGLASFFYLNAAIFLVWFWVSLVVSGTFRGREFMSGLFGFLTPFFIAFGWYFWNDQLPQFANTILVNLTKKGISIKMSDIQWIYLGFLAFLMIYSSFVMLYVHKDRYTTSRKYVLIILWFLAFNIIGYFALPSSEKEQYFLSVIPVTYLTSHYFSLKKNIFIKEMFFLMLVIFTIAVRFLV